MASVQVDHTIGALEASMTRITTTARKEMSSVVRKNVKVGNALARRLAREKAGPHGKNYYKRITSEMITPLSGEYGPTGVVDNNAVGAGWRHGAANTDLPRSADVVGHSLAREAQALPDKWFWL